MAGAFFVKQTKRLYLIIFIQCNIKYSEIQHLFLYWSTRSIRKKVQEKNGEGLKHSVTLEQWELFFQIL